MPKHFKVFRQMALGYTLIVGLAIGLITPIVQAEAPTDNLYSDQPTEIVVDGLTQIQRAQKIDTFFMLRDNSPLAGYGMAFVRAADAYGIDWKLLPAIATIESNGGRALCNNIKGKNNPFGFGSCKIKFKDFNEAIDVVAQNLGGHNPNTAEHYQGKTLTQVLDAYNPPQYRQDYKQLVTWAMKKIASTNVPTTLATATVANGELAINK